MANLVLGHGFVQLKQGILTKNDNAKFVEDLLDFSNMQKRRGQKKEGSISGAHECWVRPLKNAKF